MFSGIVDVAQMLTVTNTVYFTTYILDFLNLPPRRSQSKCREFDQWIQT